jgi:hypothetical protein
VAPADGFAVALSQQPKIRRTLRQEIADFNANAEARAFANEAARAHTQSADSATQRHDRD